MGDKKGKRVFPALTAVMLAVILFAAVSAANSVDEKDTSLGDGGFTECPDGFYDLTAISAGHSHAIALKSDGTVWAWGQNSLGQLGNGTVISSSTPVQVVGLTDVKAISAGGQHNLALKNDGTVWSWGWNDYGQLGDNMFADRTVPVQVIGLTDVKAIAAGYSFSLALKDDESLWSWGYNGNGQLGIGSASTHWNGIPLQVLNEDNTGYLDNVKAIAAGGMHSLVLKNDGTVWAWGSNVFNSLGDGTGGPDTDRYLPVQVVAGESGGVYLNDVKEIAAGTWHSVAVKNDGTVWTWGMNDHGQIGNGTAGPSTKKNAPVQVSDEIGTGKLANIEAVAAGEEHVIALKADGTVRTWGWNGYGQLGNGTNADGHIPIKVPGKDGIGYLEDVKAVAAGYAFSIVLKNDGTVWTWGSNNFGQLGVCTNANSGTAVETGHTFGPAWGSDASGHKNTCTACSEDVSSRHTGPWTTDVLPTHAADGTRHRECTECGYTETELIPALGHTFGTEWKSDEDGHWHECDCGARADEGPHAFGSDWESDEDEHWHECECGARGDVSEHIFDGSGSVCDCGASYKGGSSSGILMFLLLVPLCIGAAAVFSTGRNKDDEKKK